MTVNGLAVRKKEKKPEKKTDSELLSREEFFILLSDLFGDKQAGKKKQEEMEDVYLSDSEQKIFENNRVQKSCRILCHQLSFFRLNFPILKTIKWF